LERLPGDPFESFQTEREMAPPLGVEDRVDLIDDHGPYRLEHRGRPIRGEHQVERLGRGDQNVGRLSNHALAGLRRGVAGAHRHADLRQIRVVRPHARERDREIPFDVVIQSFER